MFLDYHISSIVPKGLLRYLDISSTLDFFLYKKHPPPYVLLLATLLLPLYLLLAEESSLASVYGGLFSLLEFLAHSLMNMGMLVLFYSGSISGMS